MKKLFVLVCLGGFLFSCSKEIIDDGGQTFGVRFANIERIKVLVSTNAEKAINESDFWIKAKYGAAGSDHRVKDAKTIEYKITELWKIYPFSNPVDIYEIWYESSHPWLSFSFPIKFFTDIEELQIKEGDLFITVENRWYRPPMYPGVDTIKIIDYSGLDEQVTVIVEYTSPGAGRETSQEMRFTKIGDYNLDSKIDVYRITSEPKNRASHSAESDSSVLFITIIEPIPPDGDID
jgi:hypothetical protein